ncbi:bifunctional aminoglycoside phosphotransferase/ATP-binding protein [Rhizobium sp. C4]|uniref:bifunctional aminoglycoside phosphotransferase/ATP-binding protein n=1 Tax=Rhizobium sp. C4 TaxID=1349800 RepID=UPI001E2A3F75|nr:bifunctional aminoglycoside phosphotransferase/ATP-binding protein [Rhizobium sp. C4]MCD2173403.1 AAA family ATPase [Rhizobium sp. C4]
MITDDQKAVTTFLSQASSYGLAGPVEVMETHISRIFLVGERAFKMKRAVKLPYVDFSTPELRVAACEKERALNARTTPELYLGVRLICRDDDGSLSFGSSGTIVDAVVEMKRFDQSALFDRMAMEGELTPALMTELARMVAAFHAGAPVATGEGGAANIAGVLDINKAGFATSTVFSDAEQVAIDGLFRKRLEGIAAHLDRRAEAGKIRLCHGDLHLRNLCLLEGKPRLFDCIDFNDRIATIDVLYDLSFLVMDLWHRGLKDHANLVANRYCDAAGEEEGFALLPFFTALRAAVRSHVTATQADEAGGDDRLAAAARSYCDLALHTLYESGPKLVAIGGFSGSGKSTVADGLAAHLGPPPGARLIESDRVRKALHGVSPETHLDATAYSPDMSARVYAEMAARAGAVLKAGASVVADAVHDRAERRAAIGDAATSAGVSFTGIWLDAPAETLRARVAARQGGQSDATPDVLEQQLAKGVSDVRWHKVDATGTVDAVIEDVLALK